MSLRSGGGSGGECRNGGEMATESPLEAFLLLLGSSLQLARDPQLRRAKLAPWRSGPGPLPWRLAKLEFESSLCPLASVESQNSDLR